MNINTHWFAGGGLNNSCTHRFQKNGASRIARNHASKADTYENAVLAATTRHRHPLEGEADPYWPILEKILGRCSQSECMYQENHEQDEGWKEDSKTDGKDTNHQWNCSAQDERHISYDRDAAITTRQPPRIASTCRDQRAPQPFMATDIEREYHRVQCSHLGQEVGCIRGKDRCFLQVHASSPSNPQRDRAPGHGNFE